MITKEHNRDKLVQTACNNLTETNGYNAAWIVLHNESKASELFHSSGFGPELLEFEKFLLSGQSVYCIKKSLSENGVHLIYAPVHTCGNCPLASHYHNLSAMSVKIQHGETLFGILTVSLATDMALYESERSLLQEVADDIAFALHNIKIEKEARLVKDRESVLAEMIDIAPNSITIHDMEGNFEYANQKTASLHGYTMEEFMNINLKDLDVPDSVALHEKHFKIIDYKKELHFEAGHIRKDGSTFPLEVYAKKILWKNKPAVLSIATDITKRKRTEEKLKASEEQYRILVENANDIIYSISSEGIFTYISPNWMQFMGEHAQEAIGKSFEHYVHPDDRDIVRNFLKKVETTGLKQSSEAYRFRHRNGSWQWHISNGSPIKDNKNIFMGCMGIARDVTEQKRTEESLLESESRFHKMLRAIPDMVSIHDPDMNILYSNWNGFAAIDNHKRILGEKCYRIYRGRENICPNCRAKKVLESKEPYHEEVMFPDGSWYNIRFFPILDTKGDASLFVEVVQDITLIKQSENDLGAEKERLMVTLQSIGDGVITTDTKGNIVLLNRAAEEMTGWSSSEAKGRQMEEVFNIINDITRKKAKNPVSLVLASGKTVELPNHTSLLTKNKHEIVIADSAAPIKNINNETIGVVLVFRDMTEKTKLDNAVEVSSKLESLGVLAGGIAHDFNNLLGGIYGYIDLALESEKDETISQYLNQTISTIERARSLTQQLLTFAKGGSPVQKIAPLFPFVKETAIFALSGTNVTISFEIQPDLWNCNYDRNQIGQVIDNIIINAQQAMPVGGNIELTAKNITFSDNEHAVLGKGNFVHLSIKDYGIGIPKNLLTKIFDPFFTTKAKGHGLGLATCYSIINRHGGHISVYSETGKGTLFHIYLPAANEVSADDNNNEQARQHNGSGRFLVMDDEDVIRQTTGAMLSSLGYEVILKNDGKEAVDYFREEINAGRTISAMIFDLTIPGGMGGREAIENIRSLNKEIPVFVSSGYAEDPVMKNPTSYGFTASICKPFRRFELIEVLQKHMNTGN